MPWSALADKSSAGAKDTRRLFRADQLPRDCLQLNIALLHANYTLHHACGEQVQIELPARCRMSFCLQHLLGTRIPCRAQRVLRCQHACVCSLTIARGESRSKNQLFNQIRY